MAYLKVRSNTGATINPDFSKVFIAVTENEDCIGSLDNVSPFLSPMTDEQRTESNVVQTLAAILIVSNETLAVKWGTYIYVGDVDRMDNEPTNWYEESTVVQYCIEDSFLCPWCSVTGFHDSSYTDENGEFCTKDCAFEAAQSLQHQENPGCSPSGEPNPASDD